MADAVTICNLALSRIGKKASVTTLIPPDGEEAEACSRFYPLALSSMLDLHDWAFATKRAGLSELADGAVEKGPWAHAYSVPADCKRVINLEPGGHDNKLPKWMKAKPLPIPKKIPFEVVGTHFGRVILTDYECAYVRYVCSEPKESQFSGLFTDALVWLLAAYLAGETVRGDTGFKYVQSCQSQFQSTVQSAMQQDARQKHVPRKHIAPWVEAR